MSVHVPHGWVTVMMSSSPHGFRQSCVNVASGMCWGALHHTIRDLETLPRVSKDASAPKSPMQSLTAGASRSIQHLEDITVRMVRRSMGHRDVTRRVQSDGAQTHRTRRMAGDHPSSSDGRAHVEARASRDATDHDARYLIITIYADTWSSRAIPRALAAELAPSSSGACIEASFKRGKGEVA